MNKQEAIEKIYTASWDDFNYKGLIVDVETVNKIIYQIDEPQKVTVPKFVADFYESIKDDFENKVYDLCLQFSRDICELSGEVWELSSQLCEWFDCVKNEPIQTLVEMKLYGYEIEQEKLYTVEIPDPNSYYNYRYLSRNHKGIFLNASCNRSWKTLPNNQLTESEIKQDFKWAWDAGFAKEVE